MWGSLRVRRCGGHGQLRARLDEDWAAAGHAYAEEHDRHYGVIHTVSGWFGEMFYAVGAEAEARRAHTLPLIAPTRCRPSLDGSASPAA